MSALAKRMMNGACITPWLSRAEASLIVECINGAIGTMKRKDIRARAVRVRDRLIADLARQAETFARLYPAPAPGTETKT